MIIKNVDSVASTDKFLNAGLNAEKQMAYYLGREFKDTKDISVLNGIRLEADGDSAQIDHLIIHKYGMVIVESKSVFGKVKINDYGEWYREDYKIGMASPVEQAKRQASFLKKYLGESGLKLPHGLLRKITFDDVPIDVLVAISDKGIITRPRKYPTEDVHKADMIVGKIKEIIENYQKQDTFFSLNLQPLPVKIAIETINAIAQYIKTAHTPLPPKQDKDFIPIPLPSILSTTISKPIIPAPLNVGFHCKKCGSDDISILFGKHGYYFRCKKCDDTMSLNERCSQCGQLLKLRKDRNQFYIECKKCGTSKPFFKNSS